MKKSEFIGMVVDSFLKWKENHQPLKENYNLIFFIDTKEIKYVSAQECKKIKKQKKIFLRLNCLFTPIILCNNTYKEDLCLTFSKAINDSIEIAERTEKRNFNDSQLLELLYKLED